MSKCCLQRVITTCEPYSGRCDCSVLIYSSEHINISIDPYTGRNPSYFFVELVSKEQADRAMLELDGKEMLGRPARIGPGVARSGNKHPRESSDQYARDTRDSPRPVFDRWTRTDAPDHWKGYSEQGRRVYVGGLPRMSEHHNVNDDVRELFRGYSVCVLLFPLEVSLFTNTVEGRLSVRSSSLEHQHLVIQALGIIAIFSSISLPPRRRSVPRKQRMGDRLGASKSESSRQTNQTLGNLAKDRRGTRSSRHSLNECAVSRLLEPPEIHPIAIARRPHQQKAHNKRFVNICQLRDTIYLVSLCSPICAWWPLCSANEGG